MTAEAHTEAEVSPEPSSDQALRWRIVAAGVCLLALLTLFHAMLGVSWRDSVPVNVARGNDETREYPRSLFEETDHRFVVWQGFRNAYTLASSPSHLFEAEPCHPAHDALAFGEPGIGVGILGIPFMWLTGDPIATYNWVLMCVVVIAFASMYLLVKEWTGVPEAAIVAALLFAFHEIRIKDPIHFYAWDNSWTVLALYLTTKLFTRSRFVDAVALAFVIGMQLAGSLYPVMTAIFVAVPVGVWLVVQFGVRGLRPLHLLFVIACALLVAVPIFAPYLAQSEAGVLADRAYQVFFDFRWLTPAGPAFPGWAMIVLAAVALALPRRMGRGESGLDPRIPMLVIAILLLLVSVGGNTASRLAALESGAPPPLAIPSLYDALATIIPGLSQVRGPAALYVGVHMALCVLAGFGAAGLIRMAGLRRGAVGAILIALVFVESMRPAWLGMTPRMDYTVFSMRPPAAELEFFERISAKGRAGPLLELPFNPKDIDQSSRAVLLAAYHRRRTAQCFNSFQPPVVGHVKATSERLPDSAALDELVDMGFSTIVVRGRGRTHGAWNAKLAPLVRTGRLALLERGPGITAYAIEASGLGPVE